jgi:hypothetical protein
MIRVFKKFSHRPNRRQFPNNVDHLAVATQWFKNRRRGRIGSAVAEGAALGDLRDFKDAAVNARGYNWRAADTIPN